MQAARKYRQPSPAIRERLYQERTAILDSIEARDIVPLAIIPSLAPMREQVRQELRHRIRDRNHGGEFLPMVCDHCYSELWRGEDHVTACPGCGWVP